MLYTKILNYYQYISRMFPPNCRYYPSCSEYAKQQFMFNRFDRAFISSILRILRCNQLFRGGIDYPVIIINNISNRKLINNYVVDKNIKIKYWMVHKKKNQYITIKVI